MASETADRPSLGSPSRSDKTKSGPFMITSQQPPSSKPSEDPDTSLAPSRSDEAQMYCWSERFAKARTVRRPKGLVGWCLLGFGVEDEVNNIWNFFDYDEEVTLNCTYSAM
jgi:hypothetical protein